MPAAAFAQTTSPAPASLDPATLRQAMVDRQLRTFDITDAAVLEAFETVPREKFVGVDASSLAYSDAVLIVKAGDVSRTLLTPMTLARLLATTGVRRGDRALDIGGGLGYSAAILAALGASVVALEAGEAMTSAARAALAGVGSNGVDVVAGGLADGCAAKAPYDLILINGAVEFGVESLFAQLAPGGRLAAIVRTPGQSGRSARATRFERLASGVIAERWLFDAAATTLDAFRQPPAFVF